MRLFRKRDRLRPLDERECYLRLHGMRSGEIAVVPIERRPSLAPVAEAPPPDPDGPTDEAPALHLLIPYPRTGARLTGEEVRRELLRRMRARTGEAA